MFSRVRIRARCRSHLYFGYKIIIQYLFILIYLVFVQAQIDFCILFCPEQYLRGGGHVRNNTEDHSSLLCLEGVSSSDECSCLLLHCVFKVYTVAFDVLTKLIQFFLDGIHLYTNGDKPAVFQNTTWYAENKHIFKTFGKSCLQSTICLLLR